MSTNNMDNKVKILNIFSGVGGGISSWIKKESIFCSDEAVVDAMAFSITNKSNFQDIITNNGGTCYEMPRKKNGLIKLIKYVKSVIRENNYQVVHCHIDGFAAIPFWIAARVCCKKVFIVHGHRTAIEKYEKSRFRKLIYWFNRLCNKFYKNKVACGKKASKFSYGKTKKVKIIYNGMDLFEDAIIKNKEDKINILSLGRLNRVKNHEFMLKIASELKTRNVEFHMFFVGDGDLREDLKKKIIERQLSDYVSLEGYCDNPSSFLTKSEFLLLPSLSEGLPTVMLEAQQFLNKVIVNSSLTRECDLNLGQVFYLGINDGDIVKWADLIVAEHNNTSFFNANEINEALKNKGFVNSVIYKNYLNYIRSLIGDCDENN